MNLLKQSTSRIRRFLFGMSEEEKALELIKRELEEADPEDIEVKWTQLPCPLCDFCATGEEDVVDEWADHVQEHGVEVRTETSRGDGA
ncbi:hypothetical protein [Halarchaeum sp. P4]|uniref:hypothetical protein n=1 Tax=Halarchaeum sp. P4 TaxID=3421639 RepID=UPI003EBA1D86